MSESFICLRLDIMDGMYCPVAFIANKIVVVCPLSALVTDDTNVLPFCAITFKGLCTHVKSDLSQLKM